MSHAAPDISTPEGRLSALALEAGSAWSCPPHIAIIVSYKPIGPIDFNRPDLILREVRDRIGTGIWLRQLRGWNAHDECDHLAFKVQAGVLNYGDYPRDWSRCKWERHFSPNVKDEPRPRDGGVA